MNRKRFPHSFLAALLALIGGAAATAEPAEIDLSNNPRVLQFRAWQQANALRAVALGHADQAMETREGNRIGGPAWLPEGEAWPLDSEGKRMTFLAQVDFAKLPPLPDYPTRGVLQFFIGRDDLYGANFDHPEHSDFRVIWRETLEGPGRFEYGTPGKYELDDFSPLYAKAVKQGVALEPSEAFAHAPSLDSWLLERDHAELFDDEQGAKAYDWIGQKEDEAWGGHFRVGGHPEFTQSDWRFRPEYQDVDRVLLQLWTDDENLMWGDSGQGQFMIRREDLLKRDFSKVFYQWDCY